LVQVAKIVPPIPPGAELGQRCVSVQFLQTRGIDATALGSVATTSATATAWATSTSATTAAEQ
jgi:hypothetical protein